MVLKKKGRKYWRNLPVVNPLTTHFRPGGGPVFAAGLHPTAISSPKDSPSIHCSKINIYRKATEKKRIRDLFCAIPSRQACSFSPVGSEDRFFRHTLFPCIPLFRIDSQKKQKNKKGLVFFI